MALDQVRCLPRAWGRRLLAGAMLVAGGAVATPAAAQELVLYGTGAVDGYDTGIALVGASARLGNLGLQPVLGAQVFYLSYPVLGADRESRFGVNPSAGLAFRANGGQVEARLGYALVSGGGDDGDDEGTRVIEGGGGGGLNTTVQANYWGGGPELQAIAYVSHGEEYLWTQGQAALPILRRDTGGRLSVGVEGVFETDLDQGEYDSFSVGPLLRYDTGRNSAVTISGGFKDNTIADPTWYARVGVVRYGLALPFSF